MNEDFSLGKMSADARLTATFKYYEKTEQNGEIIITACLDEGDVPRLNRGYGLDGNELWLSLNNLYQSILLHWHFFGYFRIVLKPTLP